MATLPPEQVTQRTAVGLVGLGTGRLRDDEFDMAATVWQSATDGNDVTVPVDNTASYDTAEEIDAAITGDHTSYTG